MAGLHRDSKVPGTESKIASFMIEGNQVQCPVLPADLGVRAELSLGLRLQTRQGGQKSGLRVPLPAPSLEATPAVQGGTRK